MFFVRQPKPLLISLRPHQWTKNLVLAAPGRNRASVLRSYALPRWRKVLLGGLSRLVLYFHVVARAVSRFAAGRRESMPRAAGAAEHRRILGEYSPYLLYPMIAVVTASTVVSFTQYATAPETMSIFGTERLVWTLPFVPYLVHQKEEGGNPTKVLLENRPIHVTRALWAATSATSIYPGRESG